MKEKIKLLRSQGKSYNEIVAVLGCSKATVAYHCSEKVKQNFRDSRNKNRKKSVRDIKTAAGGKCVICGYDRCNRNLTFHHKDPTKKVGGIGELAYTAGKAQAIEEAKKCILVCCRCHGEIHEGLITI